MTRFTPHITKCYTPTYLVDREPQAVLRAGHRRPCMEHSVVKSTGEKTDTTKFINVSCVYALLRQPNKI